MLISLRNLAKSKANTNCSLCSSSAAILDANSLLSTAAAAAATISSSISGGCYCFCCSFSFSPNASPAAAAFSTMARMTPARDVVLSFKEWFQTRNDALLDRIFLILKSSTDGDAAATTDRRLNGDGDIPLRYNIPYSSADLALSHLSLRLTEAFVLEVLRYGSNDHDVLSCLKFFDWAGLQPDFHHTRATFNAIFKIISKAKLMSLMLGFLCTYRNQTLMTQQCCSQWLDSVARVEIWRLEMVVETKKNVGQLMNERSWENSRSRSKRVRIWRPL